MNYSQILPIWRILFLFLFTSFGIHELFLFLFVPKLAPQIYSYSYSLITDIDSCWLSVCILLRTPLKVQWEQIEGACFRNIVSTHDLIVPNDICWNRVCIWRHTPLKVQKLINWRCLLWKYYYYTWPNKHAITYKIFVAWCGNILFTCLLFIHTWPIK